MDNADDGQSHQVNSMTGKAIPDKKSQDSLPSTQHHNSIEIIVEPAETSKRLGTIKSSRRISVFQQVYESTEAGQIQVAHDVKSDKEVQFVDAASTANLKSDSISDSHSTIQPEGCFSFCQPNTQQDEIEDVRQFKWLYSNTFRMFWRVLLISVVIMTPGCILEYGGNQPVKFYGIDSIVWFTTISILIWVYPVTQMLLHIILYHMISEQLFDSPVIGNYLTYASEVVPHLSGAVSLLIISVSWNFVLPALAQIEEFSQNTIPFNYINPVLGVVALWVIGLALKRIGAIMLISAFNQTTFLDRIREDLFMDFIVETFREAKRSIKYLRKIRDEEKIRKSSGKVQYRLPVNPELLLRIKQIVIPKSYHELFLEENFVATGKSHEDDTMVQHGWKRTLNHFYAIALQDDDVRQEAEQDAEGDALLQRHVQTAHLKKLQRTQSSYERKERLQKQSQYHHLHRYNHSKQHKQIKVKRLWHFERFDDRASTLAHKIFVQLRKDPNASYLDVVQDLMPVFTWTTADSTASMSDQEQQLIAKQRKITQAVQLFLLSRSDNGKLYEQDLKNLLIKIFRERSRIVASLSGMKSVINILDEALNVVLCLILLMCTLTIFGINAFNYVLSLSSVIVSFAFLFGSSAKNAFEGIIFIFLVHPFDVGDRLLIGEGSYVVSKINLLSTVLEKWDGQLVFQPNSRLALMDIINFRRSLPQWAQVVLQVSFSTPTDKLTKLAENMTNWVLRQGVDYLDKVSVTLDSFADMETMIIKVTYGHRTNWQRYDQYIKRRTVFVQALLEEVKLLDIKFQPLVQEIKVSKN